MSNDIEEIIKRIKSADSSDPQFIQEILADKSLIGFIKIRINTPKCIPYLFYKKKLSAQKISDLLNLSLDNVKREIKKGNPKKRPFPSRAETTKKVEELKQFALEHPDYSVAKLAKHFGMSVSHATYHVKRHGIKVFKHFTVTAPKKPVTNEQKKLVVKLYKQHYTVAEIGREINLNDKSIRRILNKNKFPFLTDKRIKTDRLVLSAFKYAKSIKDTAEKTGINEYEIQQILKRHNIDYKGMFEKKVIATYKQQNKSIKWTAHRLSTTELEVKEILFKHNVIL